MGKNTLEPGTENTIVL